jgi:hypothetical protein
LMSSTAKKARLLRNRVIDYVLYIAIAFALVFFTMFVSSKWSHEVFIRWGGLGFLTFCLFGFFVQESRKFLRIRRFWEITATLLALHLLIFAIVLTHVEEWRLPWFIVMAFEYPVMLFFRDRISIQS